MFLCSSRYLSSKREPSRTCTGSEMAALHVLGTQTSFASINRSAPSKPPAAKARARVAQWTAALEYRRPSQVQTSMKWRSTHGTKCRTSGSTRSMGCILTSRVPSRASMITSSKPCIPTMLCCNFRC